MGSVGTTTNQNGVFTIPTDLTSKPKRSEVPIMRNNKGRVTLGTNELKGHVMEYKGTPFFLQKTARDGYIVNVYGVAGGRIQKLSEAPARVKELYEQLQGVRVRSGNAQITYLDDARERFNYVNQKGEMSTKELMNHMDEWTDSELKKHKRRK